MFDVIAHSIDCIRDNGSERTWLATTDAYAACNNNNVDRILLASTLLSSLPHTTTMLPTAGSDPNLHAFFGTTMTVGWSATMTTMRSGPVVLPFVQCCYKDVFVVVVVGTWYATTLAFW
jgi:hypothetical protein